VVLDLSSKGGGKYGTHSWIADSTSIGKVSYLNVQVYEHLLRGRFKDMPIELARLYGRGFGHIPSHHFLCHLPSPSIVKPDGLELTPDSWEIWQPLVQAIPAIKSAIKAMVGCSKKGGEQEEIDNSEEL
ncbi:hypothetical protein K439DRAFT_1353816, partial [Ramaria rubella]